MRASAMPPRYAIQVGVAVAAALSLSCPRAKADPPTKAQCVEANTRAQDLRRAGKHSAARQALVLCTDPACPAVVRNDCTHRLDELEKVQPTIVFVARDAAGNDVSAVKVTVDGAPLTDRLDGSELRVDPGEHVFTFTVAGQAPFMKKLVLVVGDKDRREPITVLTASSAPAPPPPAPPEARPVAPSTTAAPTIATSPSAGGMGTQKILGLTAGGLGVAGVALGSVFGVLASAASSQQKSDCPSATSCPSHGTALSEHSTMTTDGAVSTVAFAAGAVLLATGAALFFTAHGPADQATSLTVTPGAGGAGMLLRGSF
jgi:hypothetical protein